ncbi:Ig-like domain repeat protein [Rhodococcus sp. ACT016]|uniref:Ig-like domain repeat protein n=1 Tax=Rhodococcus sp. ACT016 TaxID=3134808 RepID=UPI003D2B84A6
MTGKTTRRLTAAAGVAALSVTLVGAIGAGTADAVAVTEGKYTFDRTVDVAAPRVGDTVTYSTVVSKSGVDGYINTLVDVHPACLTYVDGSAKVTVYKLGSGQTESSVTPEVGSTTTKVTNAGWLVNGSNSLTLKVSYYVPDTCAMGAANSGMTAKGTVMGGSGFGTSTDQSSMGPSVTVQQATTSTTVSAPSTTLTGQTVTLSATVAPGAAPGTVQFQDNGTNIGAPVPVASGSAAMSYSFSAAGAHNITAVYSGATAYAGSTSPAQVVNVSVPDVVTTTSVTAPQTAFTGSAVNLSATVAPSNASGTVQFRDGNTSIGAPVAVSGGVAELSHTFTAAGAHPITAVFTGAGFVSSTSTPATVSVTVPDLKTTTTVTAPSSSQTGASVTLSASVSPTPAGGTVQFKDGVTLLGAPVAIVDGTATLEHTFTSIGNHAITAIYSGAAGFEPSTSSAASVSVTDPVVTPRGTVTMLSVAGEAKTGASTDLWVTVRTSAGDAVDGGTVQFRDGGADLGGPVAVSNGVARVSHTFTSVGAHSISAVFSGVPALDGSTSGARIVTVSVPASTDADTATALTVPASAAGGTTVSLWASVVSSGPVRGTVQFFDGDAPIGEAVDLFDGTATLNHAFATSGAHRITAVYSGAAGLKGSSSDARTIDITTTETNPGGTPGTGSLAGLPIFGS